MKIVILTSIIGMGLLMLNPAAAQMHSAPSGNMPMNTPMMQSHMSSMATIMSEMAALMQNGKMTPEQQVQCGAFMQRLSGMMQNMSADPQLEKTEQRQSELQALEKEWDYWKEKEEH